MQHPIVTAVYSHGRFGSPWYGFKIEALRTVALAMGVNVVSIRYPEEMSVAEMEDKLLATVTDDVAVPGDLVFLSSSRGGYLSTRVSHEVVRRFGNEPDRLDDDKPLPRRHVLGQFLIAPAFYIKPEYYPDQSPSPASIKTTIVHGMSDDVISADNSVRFAKQHGAQLHLLGGGHRLNSQRDMLCVLFRDFLRECLTDADDLFKPWLEQNGTPPDITDDTAPRRSRSEAR